MISTNKLNDFLPNVGSKLINNVRGLTSTLHGLLNDTCMSHSKRCIIKNKTNCMHSMAEKKMFVLNPIGAVLFTVLKQRY